MDKNPPENLYEKILTGIRRQNILRAKKRLFLFVFLGILASIAIVGWSNHLNYEIDRVGFYEYTRILKDIGSDGLEYWKEFTSSLFKMLPKDIAIIVIAIASAIYLIVRQIWKSARTIHKKTLTM